jgi:hypothetical protein
MPAVVISMEAACNDNAVLLEDLRSEVAFEEPEIENSDPSIWNDSNCTTDKLHVGMPGGCWNSKDEGDYRDERDTIPTTSRRQ